MSSISSTTDNNPILIAGAGLGGLCLAQALKKHSIPFKIFERDFKQDFRAQGFRLRVSEDGILALQYALTPEMWSLFDRTSAELFGTGLGARLNALTAEPLPGAGGPPPGAHGSLKPFTVDRTTMREVLLTNLDKELHFGKHVTHYESASDGVTVYFADGTSETGALLVGADGVKSSIRKQLLPDYPFLDAGSRIIYGKTPITPEVEAGLPSELLKGMSFLSEDDTHGVPKTMLLETIRFPQGPVVEHISLPRDYIYWVLLVRRDHLAIPDTELLSLKNEQSSELAISLTEKWHPGIRTLVLQQDRSQTATLRVHSVDPAIPDWQASTRVTLLGDAIHAMPPTGAMGVNTALRDAADLAQKIVGARDSQKSLDELVGEYEQSLREFARKPLAFSWQAGSKAFGLKPVEQCERLYF